MTESSAVLPSPVPAEVSTAPVPPGSPAPGAAAAPRLSILVISYNTKAMTLDCLRSIEAETRTPHEVIVLDNVSPDGSAEAIAEAFPPGTHPHVRLIASAENHGFAKGNNIAAREARGDYLLLLNPDTLILDGAIDKLMAFAERTPEAGIWGGRTLTGDGRLDPSCAFDDQTFWSIFCRLTGLSVVFKGSALFNPEYYGSWARDSEREVGVIMGCCLLIRRDLWEALGGFDLSFVMYGEETDLCRRARDRGLARPRMTPEAEIIHFGGASSPKLSSDSLKLKARITLARRHLRPWQRPLGVGMIRIWPLTRKLTGGLAARLTGDARFHAAAARWSAVWDNRAAWRDGFPLIPPATGGGVRRN
ncbi:glycosyltransferase family 2 protein [Amaricoccus solimangrovi]|nr:glycosyltransferase family 2 protein [Amaricoccus solimangrovi]